MQPRDSLGERKKKKIVGKQEAKGCYKYVIGYERDRYTGKILLNITAWCRNEIDL